MLFDKGIVLIKVVDMTPLNNIQPMTYSQAVKECFLDALKNIGLLLAGTIIAVTPIILSILFGMFLVAFIFAPIMDAMFH